MISRAQNLLSLIKAKRIHQTTKSHVTSLKIYKYTEAGVFHESVTNAGGEHSIHETAISSLYQMHEVIASLSRSTYNEHR